MENIIFSSVKCGISSHLVPRPKTIFHSGQMICFKVLYLIICAVGPSSCHDVRMARSEVQLSTEIFGTSYDMRFNIVALLENTPILVHLYLLPECIHSHFLLPSENYDVKGVWLIWRIEIDCLFNPLENISKYFFPHKTHVICIILSNLV